jgi:hypothetical protein
MSDRDIFRPLHDPARSIYDAFQNEASKRQGRSIEEWQDAERNAVLREAIFQSQKMSLAVPTLSDVEKAEISAMGHCDYGTKWAYVIAMAMRKVTA